MNPTPKGWPRLTASIFYDEAGAAIEWLCRAFGFEVRLKVEGEGGRIEHSELTFGDGLIMVGQTGGRADRPNRTYPTSPKSIGGANTQSVMLCVDDVEAHYARARTAGARIFEEPAVHDYGADDWVDRSYGAVDPEGHHWWFTQRLHG